MDNFKILNNIEDAILVINNKNEILFHNIAFKKQFGNISDISKIKKYFNFDICILNPDDISSITPIDLILSSEENFYAYCSYQKSKDEYLYLNISAINRKGYKVIILKDVTNTAKYQQIENNLTGLDSKYQSLLKENKKFLLLKEEAQGQAIKMALLNRISLIIRDSIDTSTIINSTLKELQTLLGSSKTYYAVKSGKSFKIEQVSLKKYQKLIGSKIEFEEDDNLKIKSKQISMVSCIKEYKNSKIILSQNTKRIIIPIFHKNKLLGIIVTLTTQKDILKDNIDILQSIATQLSTSIMQASLFDQVKKKNLKLQKTLNELNETQLQLINSEKMASLGQLVAGVAHEINTPLAAINANSDLTKRLLENNPCLHDKHIQMIKDLNSVDQEAIKRISDIVKSLKRFVRLDEAELQEADINNELDLTLQLISHETKNKAKITKEYGEIPPIKCYVNMLNQVFMNILVNAAQSLNNKKQTGEITIKTTFENDELTVSIKDNGCGISKKNQNMIFSAGFTTKRKGLGTGLGLAISNKIIQKHKGSITFNSVENEGTEFIIKIPAKK